MTRIGCVLAALVVALCVAGEARAATKWLCGPGVADDPCRPRLSTALYRGWHDPVGRTVPERARDRGVACFYVYPTVSDQQTRLATKRIDPELRSIALYQAARFSQLCRVYAPVYRQATVPALQTGRTTRGDYLAAYGDVEAAFRAFVRRIGSRRGFVLIGHSQGAYHLQRLIRTRIDDRPALRRRLVSAVLLGGNVTVRQRSDRGGVFHHVPTCERAGQLGCVIAFSTFNQTPPDPALFGRGASRVARLLSLPDRAGLETACTNPAALGSNRSVPLISITPTAAFAPGSLIAAGISLLGSSGRPRRPRSCRPAARSPAAAHGRAARMSCASPRRPGRRCRRPRRRLSGACTWSTPTSRRAISCTWCAGRSARTGPASGTAAPGWRSSRARCGRWRGGGRRGRAATASRAGART